MDVVTLSPKFQVVVPKAVREELGLRPGTRMLAVIKDGCVQLVPVRSARDLKGFVRGIDTAVPREEDRR